MSNRSANLLDLPDCVRCGHAYGAHYNTRQPGVTRGMIVIDSHIKRPCHKLGKHDMRCLCRNYVAPKEVQS